MLAFPRGTNGVPRTWAFTFANEGLQAKLQKGGRELFLWIIGIIGFFLLADSVRYCEFFGLVELSR